MTDKESEARAAFNRCEGYINAIKDYGIWRSGAQYIGCMERPVKEVEEKIRKQMDEYWETIKEIRKNQE